MAFVLSGCCFSSSIASTVGPRCCFSLHRIRAIGKASHPLDPSQMIPRSLDVKFNVALMKADEELPASAEAAKKTGGPAANVKPTVTGTFMGNGKETAKIEVK